MELEGILTSLELCYKCAEYVVEKIENYRNADDEVVRRINRVEVIWEKTRQQTELLRQIDDALSDEYRRIVDQSIGLLGEKLSKALTSVQGALGNEHGKRIGFHGFGVRVRRGKYAFLKDTLDEIIKDLEDYHKTFDPTWFLVLRMAASLIDQQLQEMRSKQSSQSNGVADAPSNAVVARAAMGEQSPIAIAQDIRRVLHSSGQSKSIMRNYLQMDRDPIPYSTAFLAKRWSDSKGRHLSFIIDGLDSNSESTMKDLEKDVRNLAARLTNSDPYTFGLLRCKCPMLAPSASPNTKRFELVLHVPEGMEKPASLRQMLLQDDGKSMPSLTRRLRIAQQLANSVSYVHNFSFVHKGICPESILLLESTQDTVDHGKKTLYTFLTGFGNFRAVNAKTALIGDSAWEKNIYRHPARQGESLQEPYRMQHDVYSLGVCLLEVGLWQSFVEYASETEPKQPKDSKAYQDFHSWMKSRDQTGVGDSQENTSRHVSMLLRDYVVHLAETRLPNSMGELYKDVVIACLSSGGGETEQSEAELGQEASEDEDGIKVGVHFIKEILGKLAEIKL